MSAIQTNSDRATAQRAEIHVGLSDQALTALAVRSMLQIPAQQAGDVYKQVVLKTDGDTVGRAR